MDNKRKTSMSDTISKANTSLDGSKSPISQKIITRTNPNKRTSIDY